MTSTKVCGLTTTSWRPMLFKRFNIHCRRHVRVVSPCTVTCFAQSDSTLADRIEAGDRKAALEMIARNVPVNARATRRVDTAALGGVPRG